MINHKERAHAVLSASSAHRWLACPPSACAALLYEETSSEFAAEGTKAHEVAEVIASGGSVAVGDGVTAEMVRHAEEYRDYIEGLKTSDDAVVLLEQRVDFSPWVPDGFGTCDCILIQGDELVIIDYKFGVGVPVSAVDNPQMKLYALGALNDYGFAYEVAKVSMHIFQPRIGNISDDALEVAELLKWADSVRSVANKAASGKGKYKEGAHCKFCPHAARCRKLASACREIIQVHDLAVKVPVLAPHEIAEILELEPLVSLWLKRVKSLALEQLLAGEDIPGYKAVEGRGSRVWSDENLVADTLAAAGYEADQVYTKPELLSPAQMEKALGKKKAAELVGNLIEKKAGSPAVAPLSDKREPISLLEQAQKDFE